MKIVICWNEINGYMAACWRALSRQPEIELLVVAGQPGCHTRGNLYDGKIGEGINCCLMNSAETRDYSKVFTAVSAFKPDIVFLPGWSNPAFNQLVECNELQSTKFMMGFDTVMDRSLGQYRERWKTRRLLPRISLVVVPGERGFQYANRVLGVPVEKIRTGLYGYDFESFTKALSNRHSEGQRLRRFLFVGRYVPVKGLRTLIEAYQSYRQTVTNPWPLTCCGSGELSSLLNVVPGIRDIGFVQPTELPGVFAQHDVLILPSEVEPWGVIIGEAAASGLPIVCSSACGSSVELVRPYHNGLIVAPGDACMLKKALLWMHEHHVQLPAMGINSQHMAKPFAAEQWANCWRQYFEELTRA